MEYKLYATNEDSSIIEEISAEFDSDKEAAEFVESHKDEGYFGWEKV